MFETRISKSWGIGEDVLARFFLESLHEDISGGLLLFIARDKLTGRKLWLKVSDESEAANTTLAAEAALWDGIEHPNLLAPCQQDVAGFQDYIAYPWQDEVPFKDTDQAALSPPDLVRICIGLLNGVMYLQSLKNPVAHNQLGKSSLCLAASHHWPILTGFHLATSGASEKVLMKDRQACLDAISKICFGTGMAGNFSDHLEEPAKAWVKEGTKAADGLLAEMDREFIRRVIADL